MACSTGGGRCRETAGIAQAAAASYRREPGVPQVTGALAETQRSHRISLATAILHGREGIEVARQLNDRLRGLTLYCDGWAHDDPTSELPNHRLVALTARRGVA